SAAQTPPAKSPPAASEPAMEAPDEAMEEPRTGDHWTYEVRDEITGEVKSTLTQTITDVSGSEISVRVAPLGKANSWYLTFDHLWNLKSNGVWRYSPNDGTGIRLPLAVGKTWTVRSTDINSTAGVNAKRGGTAKALA